MQLARILAVGALAGAFAGAQPVLSQDVTLEFVVWNYSLETIQDNIAKFEAENPGIKVNVTDYAWQDYNDSLVLRSAAIRRPMSSTAVRIGCRPGAPPASSRRSSVAPEGAVDELAADIAGFALTDVTYDGKVYGLPYYSDTISFIYNKKILEDHGIPVPTTWRR